MQTYLETEQNLSVLLERAESEGEVRVRRENGHSFILSPEQREYSPLDVEGVDLNVSTSEIVALIREGRERE